MAEDQMMEIKTKFEGHWKLDRSENFEAFLQEMGANIVLRKLAGLAKPSSEIKFDGDKITITLNAGFMNKSDTFNLGEEFESDFQGDKYWITVTYQDGLLMSKATPFSDKQKPQKSTRERVDDEMLMTMYVGDVICKRYFKRV